MIICEYVRKYIMIADVLLSNKLNLMLHESSSKMMIPYNSIDRNNVQKVKCVTNDIRSQKYNDYFKFIYTVY